MLLYLDCSNGVSGDMLVAALLDVSGARPGTRGPLDKVVRPALKAAGIEPRLATIDAVRRDGVAALVFRVADAPGFASFDELIVSMYASEVGQYHADVVAAVAERLRAAERAVHGEDGEGLHGSSGIATAVHLIATAALFSALAPERVIASPPALGAGTVETACGESSVPTPVVLQLLHGLPLDDSRTDGEPFAGELTTPTGAALLAHFADEFGDLPAGAVSKEGIGAGAREASDRPGVLRVVLVEPEEAADDPAGAPAADPTPAEHVVLETNIDDMSAELLAHAAETLREDGALDVWTTPALMKKGRPGVVLHVLAAAADQDRLAELVFTQTSTFGIRVVPVARLYAEQRREAVRIAGHDIGVRLGFAGGRLATVSPEYEDCLRAAAELGRPVRVVYEAAQARARSRFSGS